MAGGRGARSFGRRPITQGDVLAHGEGRGDEDGDERHDDHQSGGGQREGLVDRPRAAPDGGEGAGDILGVGSAEVTEEVALFRREGRVPPGHGAVHQAQQGVQERDGYDAPAQERRRDARAEAAGGSSRGEGRQRTVSGAPAGQEDRGARSSLRETPAPPADLRRNHVGDQRRIHSAPSPWPEAVIGELYHTCRGMMRDEDDQQDQCRDSGTNPKLRVFSDARYPVAPTSPGLLRTLWRHGQ